ncbi:PEPxxWA-CTERM sorting domain-containing protein [Qipengyuania sp.]|uniref:PEPxxWA-CTERM sorting domain-containing protein n=1 Tax=Qipengyuania sp. TaxID=2004515 RepID=UPI0035C8607C
MKNFFIAFALSATIGSAANAATDLTSVMVTGPSGTVWNTAQDSFYAVFLQRPIGTLLNPDDDFAGAATTEGGNNFTIAGDGFRPGETGNSDPSYTLTLMFADGATISGQYAGSTFTGGTSAMVGNTTYTLTGFGWDRSNADNVSRYQAVSGDDPADYTGQFSFTAMTGMGAVPEPAVWAIMVLGFGAIGGGLRRRARKFVTSKAQFICAT